MEYEIVTCKRDIDGEVVIDKKIGSLELKTVPAIGRDIKVGSRKYKVKWLNLLTSGYRQIVVDK